MTSWTNRPRRAGFTLVELLTVIGIIALLIGILIPSLARARTQARKVATAATISAIDKGLEMFHNDFGQYPDSTSLRNSPPHRVDPVVWPAGFMGPNNQLTGAHWLVRALAGHDLQGVDTDGLMLRDGSVNTINVDAATALARRGTYMEADQIFREDTHERFRQDGDAPNTGRPLLIDAFDGPILYYRANPRRPDFAFDIRDNALITGSDVNNLPGWDFSGALQFEGASGPRHAIGFLGMDGNDLVPEVGPGTPFEQFPVRGRTFTGYLHNRSTFGMTGTIRAVNRERFVLISAGPDGVFGTTEDVNNFDQAR